MDGAEVVAIYRDGAPVNELHEGELGVVVLDETPFYAESGGQVGDRGELRAAQGIFKVEDTLKIQAAVFGHHGVVKTGTLSVGNTTSPPRSMCWPQRTMRNHSATHLLHKSLREVLGDDVQQKGSLVTAERLRFDFSHPDAVSAADLAGTLTTTGWARKMLSIGCQRPEDGHSRTFALHLLRQ